MYDYFSDDYDPTLENIHHKMLLVDEKPCVVEVVDTSGQEDYTALRDHSIRNGQGFLLIYDVARRSSFTSVETIYKTVQRVKNEKFQEQQQEQLQTSSSGVPRSKFKWKWYSTSKTVKPEPWQQESIQMPSIILVGNKVDLSINERKVSSEEGKALAANIGAEFIETSAKTDINIEEAFSSIVRALRNQEKEIYIHTI